MNVDGETLVELTQAVWQAFVDPELPLVDLTGTPLQVAGADVVVGSIVLHGPPTARVLLALPRQAASAAAARMFDLDPADLGEADVHDATGELTNMIGGNVKALLEGEHRLGLPSVVTARGPDLAESSVASATLLWGEHVLRVTLDNASGGTL